MGKKNKYDQIANGELCFSSDMAIIPRHEYILSKKSIEKSLINNSFFKFISLKETKNENGQSSLFIAEVEYLKDLYTIEIQSINLKDFDIHNFAFANHIDKESLIEAHEHPMCVEISMFFGENSLRSFHLQLKFLYALVPDACLVIDFMAHRLFSAQWLAMTAQSPTPPSPDYLYMLHCMYDHDKEKDVDVYWFHTYGLLRCGIVELEMLNIVKGVDEMNKLMNIAIKIFITNKTKERESISIGYDGMNINLCWLRWEEALRYYPSNILGQKEDRVGADNIYAEPSGVLFAVEDGEMIPPQIYTCTIGNNPIYYIDNNETSRMKALAKERFDLFRKVFSLKSIPRKNLVMRTLFPRKKDVNTEWVFLVKIGLTSNNLLEVSSEEHLWYELLAIKGDQIEVRLINTPYMIPNLKEGDVKKYSVDFLTDWVIFSPDKAYTTDSIYQLSYLDDESSSSISS